MLSEQATKEYESLTTGVGRVELTDWTTVRLSGDDRASFLHNLCTNDIKSLQPGDQCEAFLTDVKGKIVAHVLVFSAAEQLILLTVPGQGNVIVSHLDRYLIRENVELSDDSNDRSWSIIAGEGLAKSAATIQALLCPLVPAPAYLLARAAEHQPLEGEMLARMDASDCGPDVLNALRIEAGWPLFGTDFDGTNLPQEIARNESAIHFNKGCYLGQETIARIDALGRVNQELRQVKLAHAVPAALPIDVFLKEKKVGRLTSASYSPKHEAVVGIAMLRREALDDSSAVLLCDGAPLSILNRD
ncbi:CAF17-like 4Fe-4S cluster assembly/insertion protein YgfZ [Adhaeretor mobilis]|uniref:Aminomethyltransferase n=1 Tax=Adhaeretor mobilis TaxID=1930276 RepID=A0A517MSY8_9BACT|nr:folate-binding protein YgfZ [Adhaeretor mobilis]QDS97907.1 Aminomethyltransferase [Adhaeretor mobilis]